jgi:SAM-dependent methyltransferase
MPTREVVAQFDAISPVYDETRDPLDAPTLRGLAEALRAGGAESLLEVGVGTGRIARPLVAEGFGVTGVDASRGMMARARSKGLSRLVRGSAYRLPFRDGAFDAALFVHVLHVLDDPTLAVREAQRVARGGAFALVHPRTDDDPAPRADRLRGMIRDALADEGYPVPQRSGPGAKERDFLAAWPPDAMRVLSERDVVELLRDRLAQFEKRGHRYLLDIPPEAVHRAVESVRERVGDRTVTYHRVEALAHWSSAPTIPRAGTG